MLFEDLLLPNQAIVPLGIALAHLMLGFFIIFNQKNKFNTFHHLFIAYLLVTTLWNVNLAIIVFNVPDPFPSFTWQQLIPYGLVILGVFYWAFTRAFLHQLWKTWWGWTIAVIGLGIMITLEIQLFSLPPQAFAWSNGWINTNNIVFVLGAIWWGLLMGLTLITNFIQQFRTQNPAHRNRIQYLLIIGLLLITGYSLYLALQEPLWTTGLIISWLGNALVTYIVTIEDLLDLATGARRTINVLIVALVTITTYIGGIYLVQIFLGDFLASTFLANFLNPSLLVAAVTAVLLTVIYTPLRRIVRILINRILFGRSYSYQIVIQTYTQKITNILYLNDLVNAALGHIKETLGLDHAVLLILDSESSDRLHFRVLPDIEFNGTSDNTVSFTKNTPIIQRLVEKKQPLAQYTIDVSSQFRDLPDAEREGLKTLNFDWFIPILKKKTLIGIFALGTKRSKRRYTAKDLRLLAILADQTALALENARLVDRLQRNLEETTRMKNLMDNVFDSMDNGVITADLANRITLLNKAAQSILEIPIGNSSIGQPYTKVIPALAKTIFPNLVTHVMDQENHYIDYEIISELPERGRVNLNMNLAPLKDANDKTLGVTMVMNDITKTKRLEAVQDMFRRYVSPAVVDRLPADASELELGGHRQEISVLFADIRGFTAFSEKLSPERLVDTLNEYLSLAATSILMYEGTLDKFMGDAVMGIFNAPLEQKDHILRSVRAAIAMQRAISDFHHNMGQDQEALSFGVGLHVGEAVVGNIGMSDRMDYTAIGDTVNLAKRIQENSSGGKILMSDSIYEIVKDSIEAVFFKEMQVKGREQPVKTYEIRL